MRKHVLVLTTTAAVLASGAIAASAQAPVAQTPATQPSPTTQPIPGGSMMQQRLQDHVQSGEEEDSDQDGRMMGMMRRGYGHHGCHRGHGMVGMRIIFSLMDADGDGTVWPWMPTTMAPLAWRKCRISCAGLAGRLPTSSRQGRAAATAGKSGCAVNAGLATLVGMLTAGIGLVAATQPRRVR